MSLALAIKAICYSVGRVVDRGWTLEQAAKSRQKTKGVWIRCAFSSVYWAAPAVRKEGNSNRGEWKHDRSGASGIQLFAEETTPIN